MEEKFSISISLGRGGEPYFFKYFCWQLKFSCEQQKFLFGGLAQRAPKDVFEKAERQVFCFVFPVVHEIA